MCPEHKKRVILVSVVIVIAIQYCRSHCHGLCRKSHAVACEDDAEAEKDKIRLKPIFEHPKSHCSKKKV